MRNEPGAGGVSEADPVPADSGAVSGEASPSDGAAAYDALLLRNQLCFPLYACSREVIKRYKPYLTPLGLTYTQYITMMVLWERRQVTARALGRCLHLDSGTLTPLLKKLEAKGWLERRRDPADERNLLVTVTPEGDALRALAADIPERMAEGSPLTAEEAAALYRLLYRLLPPDSPDACDAPDD